ncbi:MAG: ATP-binding cassette domain-containing protein [Clostridia bacterium]
MIEISKVTKKFGTFTAIEDLSITVEEATIYGLVGYNGAGKTTLLKTVSGVYRPDGGVVRLFGEDVFDNAKMKQRLFYIPDDLYFQPYTTMQKMRALPRLLSPFQLRYLQQPDRGLWARQDQAHQRLFQGHAAPGGDHPRPGHPSGRAPAG